MTVTAERPRVADFRLPLAHRRELLDAGVLDPVAYHRDLVAYVRAEDPRLRAFVDWRPADVADPGTPSVTYKDTIDVAGYATRLGVRSGYRHYPERSAGIARRLAERGLPCAGKVSTTECALGSVKPSRNPVYPHVSTAGSSTGSAVAVAAGFCDVSVGTDSGGSLRWPAVYCGVTALRLTPHPDLLDGVHAVAPSMESVGLVVRTPHDLDWLWREYRLAELAGAGATAGGPADGPAGPLRVAVSGPPGEVLHPEVARLLSEVRAGLAARGHTVSRADLPDVWRIRVPAAELLSREAYDSFAPLLRTPDVELGADTRAAIVAGAGIDDSRYAALRARQDEECARLAVLLRDRYDLLVLPLEPGLPDPASGPPAVSTQGPNFTLVANFARLPVLAMPLTLSSQGSPLGVQVLAAPGADDLLVAAGVALAEIR